MRKWGRGEVEYGAKVKEITSMIGVHAEDLLVKVLKAEF